MADMKKHILICIALIIIPPALALGYGTEISINRLEIRNNFDPNYLQFIQSNGDAFFNNVYNRYFDKGGTTRIILYYSKTETQSRRLIEKNRHKDEAGDGFYVPSVPAIYAHYLGREGKPLGWGQMNREIIRHLIRLNYPKIPQWFKKELTDYVSEQTSLVKDKIVLGQINPEFQKILNKSITEQGIGDSVRRLMAKRVKFEQWPQGRAFARAFIYWLDKNGKLKDFLTNTQTQGYKLQSLEAAVTGRYGQIKEYFTEFIKTNCCTGEYLLIAEQTVDENEKRVSVAKILETKPRCHTALLGLAESYKREKDYTKCRENLTHILNAPQSIKFRQAALLTANTYYTQKDYTNALEYYNKAWEYSQLKENKYKLAYQIANCYSYLQDKTNARSWYSTFLNLKWDPETMKAHTEYAEKYLN
jgi:tetratricopeptide (TPR) repeat protein